MKLWYPLDKEPSIVDDFIIDTSVFERPTIKYIGTQNRRYTVLEFHRWLYDYTESNREYWHWSTPTFRLSDVLIQMNKPWILEPGSEKYLIAGIVIPYWADYIYEPYFGYKVIDNRKKR